MNSAIDIQDAGQAAIYEAYATTTSKWLKLTRPLNLGICGYKSAENDLKRVEGLAKPVRRAARPIFKNTAAGLEQNPDGANRQEPVDGDAERVDAANGPPDYTDLF